MLLLDDVGVTIDEVIHFLAMNIEDVAAALDSAKIRQDSSEEDDYSDEYFCNELVEISNCARNLGDLRNGKIKVLDTLLHVNELMPKLSAFECGSISALLIDETLLELSIEIWDESNEAFDFRPRLQTICPPGYWVEEEKSMLTTIQHPVCFFRRTAQFQAECIRLQILRSMARKVLAKLPLELQTMVEFYMTCDLGLPYKQDVSAVWGGRDFCFKKGKRQEDKCDVCNHMTNEKYPDAIAWLTVPKEYISTPCCCNEETLSEKYINTKIELDQQNPQVPWNWHK